MREQPVQHGDDESGGVFGGKRAGRKGRNHNRPYNRRPPDLEPAHSTRTRPDAPAREFLPLNAALFEPVVRGFSRDDHVVNVAFAQTCRRDSNEAGRFPAALSDSAAPQYPMPLRKPPTSWSTSAESGPLYGTWPSMPSGTDFPRSASLLRIAVRRACFHRTERSHAAIRFERSALIENRLAREILPFRRIGPRSLPPTPLPQSPS